MFFRESSSQESNGGEIVVVNIEVFFIHIKYKYILYVYYRDKMTYLPILTKYRQK